MYNKHILVDKSKYWPQKYFSILISKHLNAGIQFYYVFFKRGYTIPKVYYMQQKK